MIIYFIIKIMYFIKNEFYSFGRKIFCLLKNIYFVYLLDD